MRSARFSFALAFILVSALLSMGCLSTSAPVECSGFVKSELGEECAYEQAVLAQSPSICYSITNMTLRESCLVDANMPEAIPVVEAKKAGQGEPFQPVPSQETQPVQAPQIPMAPPSSAIESCMATQKLSADACMRAIAIENGDIAMCANITAADFRQSCIANIAITQKGRVDCRKLTDATDITLCKSYSGA